MITEYQTRNLADMFSEKKYTEVEYKGYKIRVDQFGETWDYEIFFQDPARYQWHGWQADSDFESEAQAISEAKNWLDNYIDNYDGPGDDYYAQ